MSPAVRREVLHLQSRAYPLHHRSPATGPALVEVPGLGELRPVAGSLRSLAYNPDSTIEIDLTALIAGRVSLPGVEIAACHVRILAAGTVLVVYALRHEQDLRLLPREELDALDAAVNRVLREADSPLLTAVLTASVRSGLVADIALRPDLALNGTQSPIDRQSARYNCHFVTEDPPWEPDARVPDLISDGTILLPYTYAWDRDPATPLDELLTMTEPNDVAVAQQSLLFGALIAGRWVLADLAHGRPQSMDVHAFRRFLDGLWADFHHLDGYRMESAQAPRANYLAARHVIGLDDAQERADKLLGYVSNSLQAASSQRAEELDTRLNRVAAALAVVSAASFGLDIAVFLVPDVSLGTKLGLVAGLIGMAVACLIAVVVPRVRREGARTRGPAGRRGGRSPASGSPGPSPAPGPLGTGIPGAGVTPVAEPAEVLPNG
jgi:hypothetical protein